MFPLPRCWVLGNATASRGRRLSGGKEIWRSGHDHARGLEKLRMELGGAERDGAFCIELQVAALVAIGSRRLDGTTVSSMRGLPKGRPWC